MQKRILGKSGRLVSEIGLGCWQLGGADWGDITDENRTRDTDRRSPMQGSHSSTPPMFMGQDDRKS